MHNLFHIENESKVGAKSKSATQKTKKKTKKKQKLEWEEENCHGVRASHSHPLVAWSVA